MDEIFVSSEGQGRSLARAFDPDRKAWIDPASRKKREHFSPTDLVAVALASCVLANMEAILQKSGLPAMDFEIRVLKEMTVFPHRIAAITLEVIRPSFVEDSVRKLLGKAVDVCPVKRSLSEEIVVGLVFP